MDHGPPRLIGALLLLLTLVTAVQAGPYEDGLAAYERKDYAAALRLWRPLADKGNADAQYRLGGLYYRGQGVTQDFAQALKWYRRAAQKGQVGAQLNLGYSYFHGKGVPNDYAQAAKWYRLAADRGNAMAQNNLGVMYARGQGVKQDYVQAYIWCELSAAQGNATAKVNRDKFAAKMTSAQISDARRLAQAWKAKN